MENQEHGSPISELGAISAAALNHFFAQRAMRAFWTHFDEALRHTDVNASQFCMLALLQQREPLVFGDMAAQLEMDRSNMSANLAPLLRRGLVSTNTHERDGRKRQLVVTAQGREAIASAIIPWLRAYEDTLTFARLFDIDFMRDLFRAMRDMSKHVELSGATVRPKSRPAPQNDWTGKP